MTAASLLARQFLQGFPEVERPLCCPKTHIFVNLLVDDLSRRGRLLYLVSTLFCIKSSGEKWHSKCEPTQWVGWCGTRPQRSEASAITRLNSPTFPGSAKTIKPLWNLWKHKICPRISISASLLELAKGNYDFINIQKLHSFLHSLLCHS